MTLRRSINEETGATAFSRQLSSSQAPPVRLMLHQPRSVDDKGKTGDL